MNSIAPSYHRLGVFHSRTQFNLMLSSNLSTGIHTFPRRPVLFTSTPFVGDSKFAPKIQSFAPLTHRFRTSNSHSRPSPKKWKISCFRHEEFSFGKTNEFAGDEILGEELQKPEIGKPTAPNRHLISVVAKVADAVCKVIGKPWSVPWTAETIIQVTLLWVVSFWFVGSWMIPFAAHVVGFNKESLTYRGQALFSLLTDVTEGLAGILILHRCLSRFRPLPSDWFKFSLRGKWLFDVVLGCFMFPLVNQLSQFNLDLLPVLPSTPVTLSSVEQSIIARDPVAMALYALVLVVCAPLWEEIVFRGFLLPP